MDEHVELVKAHLKRYEAILAQREALCKKHNAVPNALRAAQARRAAVVENIEATTETQTAERKEFARKSIEVSMSEYMDLLGSHQQRALELENVLRDLKGRLRIVDQDIAGCGDEAAAYDKRLEEFVEALDEEKLQLIDKLHGGDGEVDNVATGPSLVAADTEDASLHDTIQAASQRMARSSNPVPHDGSLQTPPPPRTPTPRTPAQKERSNAAALGAAYDSVVYVPDNNAWYAINCGICGANATHIGYFRGIKGLRQHIAKHTPEEKAGFEYQVDHIIWTHVSEDDVQRNKGGEAPHTPIKKVKAGKDILKDLRSSLTSSPSGMVSEAAETDTVAQELGMGENRRDDTVDHGGNSSRVASGQHVASISADGTHEVVRASPWIAHIERKRKQGLHEGSNDDEPLSQIRDRRG